MSGYALTFGLLLVPAGPPRRRARPADDVHRRRSRCSPSASLLAGLAPTALLLVVARLVQGVGGGLLNPQVSGLIQQLFRGAERGKAFGLLGAVIGISTAVGPLLGGVIIRCSAAERAGAGSSSSTSRSASPRCCSRCGCCRRRTRRSGGRGHDLDPVGVALLGASVLAILFPLVQEQQWKGNGKWLLLAAGLVLLVGFLLWERRYAARGREPLVDLEPVQPARLRPRHRRSP